MKKLALLLFVAVQAISVQAQQTINFKIAYKPNMTYKQTTEQSMTNAISYGEDVEPMEQESSSKMSSTIKTGKLSNGTFPITMTLEADKDSDASAVMPEGATVYGIVKQDGMPQFDSINAPGMPAETKSAMIAMMKTMASQNMVPDRKVKVGETFSIDTPMELPMGPMVMNMNTKTTYKLTKVEGKKAYFDLNLVINMSSQIEGQEMKGSGTGTGTLVYDIDHNFFTQQNLKSNMKMDMEMQGMKMNIGVNQDMKTNVEIVPGK
jgi:hypothetical protein